VADLSFFDVALMKWIPPKSKLLEVYATNVSSVTINPRIGYRHKLFNIWINGINDTPTTLTREAVDIIAGPKTLLRYPVWLWGNIGYSVNAVGTTIWGVNQSYFFNNWATKPILDLLPDAAQDEPLTLNVVSGTSYPVIEAIYAEYPSDQAAAHDVPGGSDYWKKYFIAWFYLMSTTAGSGQ